MKGKQHPVNKPVAKPAVELDLPDTVCKCGGPYYSILGGELRCNKCKGRSPKARLENNHFARIKA